MAANEINVYKTYLTLYNKSAALVPSVGELRIYYKDGFSETIQILAGATKILKDVKSFICDDADYSPASATNIDVLQDERFQEYFPKQI